MKMILSLEEISIGLVLVIINLNPGGGAGQ